MTATTKPHPAAAELAELDAEMTDAEWIAAYGGTQYEGESA